MPNTDFVIEVTQMVNSVSQKADMLTFKETTGLNGKLSMKFYVAENTTSVMILAKMNGDQNKTQQAYLYKRWMNVPTVTSEENDRDKLNISLIGAPELNEKVRISVRAHPSQLENGACKKSVRYLVIVRSMIVETDVFDVCAEEKLIDILVTRFHVPSFKAIFYSLNGTDYLKTQSIEINVDDIFENQMTLQFNKKVAEPGEKVTLQVRATPGSVASICVIDQSVSLLKTPNELTSEMVVDKMNEFKLNSYYPSYDDTPRPFARRKMGYYSYGHWESSEARADLQVKEEKI